MRYFSSPGSPPAAMDSRQDTPKGGLPHSEISGSPGARPSPELFAACHVLHRLSVPRHPPDALTSRSPTPSPKHAAAAKLRPMSDVRGQMSESVRARPFGPSPQSLLTCPNSTRHLAWYRIASIAPPMLAHRQISLRQGKAPWLAYPCPDPAKTDMAGPASRFSRLASRCQRTEQRTENRPDAAPFSSLQTRRGRTSDAGD